MAGLGVGLRGGGVSVAGVGWVSVAGVGVGLSGRGGGGSQG